MASTAVGTCVLRAYDVRTLPLSLLVGLMACTGAPTDGGAVDARVTLDANAAPSPDAALEPDAAGERDAGADAGPTRDSGEGLDAGPTARALAPNDVSILIPLPSPPQPRADFLWLIPRAAGEFGPYFPAHRVDELPTLNGDVPDSLGYPAAMVVALRYDPCARVTPGGPCAAKLRLVAQPVPYTGAAAPALLDDSAVHLFYALTATASRDVAGALAALAAASPVDTGGPLSVHPTLLAEGPGGPFGRGLRALVLAHCRADNLTRVTVNTFAMDNWGFQQLAWRDDHFEVEPLQHLREASTSQAWLRQAERESLDDPAGTITPAPLRSFAYLHDLASYRAPDPVRTASAVATLARVENPRLTTPEGADCVSCHVASQTRTFAERRGLSFEGIAESYVPPPGVEARLVQPPELRGNLGATILFGYHVLTRDERVLPSIGRRVVYETAEVLAYLAARR